MAAWTACLHDFEYCSLFCVYSRLSIAVFMNLNLASLRRGFLSLNSWRRLAGFILPVQVPTCRGIYIASITKVNACWRLTIRSHKNIVAGSEKCISRSLPKVDEFLAQRICLGREFHAGGPEY